MQQLSFDTLALARAYIAAGLSVIPIARGTKIPNTALLPSVWDEATGTSKPTWKPFQDRLAYESELQRWFDRSDSALAIVGGVVSGGLVVLDLEAVEYFTAWRAFASELLGAELVDRLPVVATGRGRHVYLRMAAPIGNRKLAMLGKTVLAETRGEGGYVLAPPSTHPSGALYELLSGDLAQIPVLDPAQVQAVFDAARALAPPPEHPAAASPGDVGDVIGAFNKAHTIESVLATAGYSPAEPGRYIRPGGERSSVRVVDGKSIHYNTADPLHTEAPGGGSYAHTAFSAWCVLTHAGDVSAAVKAAALGLGLTRPLDTPQILEEAGRALGLASDPADTWPYFAYEGGIWMHRTEKDGAPKTPLLLCNFTAQIVRERVLDDGETQRELYTIQATCHKRTRTLDMERAEFEAEGAVGRIVAALGARARMNPHAQPRFILDAIKACSQAPEEETIYTHTGWVKGRYLMGNGYVDATGWHAGPGCQLPARLQQYQFTPPAGGGFVRDALPLFDELLDLAPPSVMVPLLGGVLLAPIAHSLQAPQPMVHICGPTGSHKTSICCAAMALWGAFTPGHPTDSWTSTANSVQRIGWHLKDAPMLIDDFKAANVKPQQVVFLLQNYGDGMARGRLDANSEARSSFPIRGTLISSGEDQPEGEASTLARILSVQLARKSVHRGHLTSIQEGAPRLQALMVSYLAWLASDVAHVANNAELHRTTRAAVLLKLEGTENATNPGRVASNVATLHVAWAAFSRFLEVCCLWPAERVEAWLVVCKRELLNLARTQIELTTQERYSQLFLEAVRGLLASGRAVLHNADGEGQEMLTSQVLIGSRDRNGVYLIAQSSYDAVCQHQRAAGRPVGYSQRALSQLLHQDGLLVNTTGNGLLVRRRIQGVATWCWHLPTAVLE